MSCVTLAISSSRATYRRSALPSLWMAEDLRIVTTVGNEAEAEMVREQLTEAGIRSIAQISTKGIRLGAAAERDIYVAAEHYDRAIEVLSADVPSEAELEALSQAPQPLED